MSEGSGASPDDRGYPRPALLVSACLVGVCCTHEATSNDRAAVRALAATHRLVPVCPEVAGGLPTPRPAAERSAEDGRVRTADGTDVTDSYQRGASVAVRLARAVGAETAILKARSPSCGSGRVYDGTHTRTLVDGDGVAAEALRQDGVAVLDEEDVGRGRFVP